MYNRVFKILERKKINIVVAEFGWKKCNREKITNFGLEIVTKKNLYSYVFIDENSRAIQDARIRHSTQESRFWASFLFSSTVGASLHESCFGASFLLCKLHDVKFTNLLSKIIIIRKSILNNFQRSTKNTSSSGKRLLQMCSFKVFFPCDLKKLRKYIFKKFHNFLLYTKREENWGNLTLTSNILFLVVAWIYENID